MSKPNDPELLRLRKVWYRKLARMGFDDLEAPFKKKYGAYDILKQYAPKKSQLQIENIQMYYDTTQWFLRNYEWEEFWDKRIWQYHSQGLKIPEIERKTRGRFSRKQIHNLIVKFREQMWKLYEYRKYDQ